MTSKLTREENVQAVFDLKAGYTLGLADVEILKRVARMALAAMDSEPVAWLNDAYLARGVVDGEAGSEDAGPGYIPVYREPVTRPAPVMFIDGDISPADADKLAKVIREFNEEDERPLAKMARIIRENPHPTNECDMPKSHPTSVVPEEAYSDDCPDLYPSQPDAWAAGFNSCRAAMLQNVTLANEGDIQAGNSLEIPEGYVLVPREPTDEMIAAAMDCDDVLFNSDETFCVQFGNIYEAMTAAAPQEVTSARVHPARDE
ncbi:hypothetical protein [Pluralibacter gergoviae]|uniref:hypothetical protein n=1 Tax=Pluralibacter gergoviae TaxID=61647 RepID=UPI00069ECB8C|nr:hypothetical protein [Pluralibacter gergoviae]